MCHYFFHRKASHYLPHLLEGHYLLHLRVCHYPCHRIVYLQLYIYPKCYQVRFHLSTSRCHLYHIEGQSHHHLPTSHLLRRHKVCHFQYYLRVCHFHSSLRVCRRHHHLLASRCHLYLEYSHYPLFRHRSYCCHLAIYHHCQW